MFVETRTRSIFKAISWRVLATITTMLIVYVFTRRTDIAVTVGVVEVLAKILLYFGHERVWDTITLGRRQALPTVGQPDPSIIARAPEGPDAEGTPKALRHDSAPSQGTGS